MVFAGVIWIYHFLTLKSGCLNSNRAIQVNIVIIRAFVKMRQIMSDRRKVAERIDELEKRLTAHDENFQVVFEAIRQLQETDEEPKRRIGF